MEKIYLASKQLLSYDDLLKNPVSKQIQQSDTVHDATGANEVQHIKYIAYDNEGHTTPRADDDNESVLEPSTVSPPVSPHTSQNWNETVCEKECYHLWCVEFSSYCADKDCINGILNNMARQNNFRRKSRKILLKKLLDDATLAA